jgi:hypothetical protein
MNEQQERRARWEKWVEEQATSGLSLRRPKSTFICRQPICASRLTVFVF